MLITLSLLTLLPAQNDALTPGDLTRTVQGRDYLIHVPKNYTGKKPVPVVLVYHGGGGNPQVTVRFTGMNTKADEAGFLVVYPSGSGRFKTLLTWNGGNCCGYAMKNNIDDVAYTKALLDDLASVANIDPKRIYATGMSNGAIMTYKLASELSDRIAAIAPVGGPMGTETCHPKRPVPVIHFHGTDDAFAPFKGGKGRSGTEFYSVEHSIQAWVKANGCPAKPKVVELPDRTEDGCMVVKKIYGPGKNGAEVVLVEIRGGGHTWPGQPPRIQFLGTTTRDISANDMMWEFFQRHPMP